MILMFIGILARFGLWNLLPNRGRRAVFYNFWGGKTVRPGRFRRRLAADLTTVTRLLADGTITPHIAARLPLTEASQAMSMADARKVHGKVVLLPPA
jgi:NADPH2:quinone reductase